MIDFSSIIGWFNKIDGAATAARKKASSETTNINTKIVAGQQFFISPVNNDLSSQLKIPRSLDAVKGKKNVSE
jgi:hypothetical protein